jgi:DNA-binding LytR/AlgR family response regulator
MTEGHEIVTRQTIGYYEQFLPAQLFLRIHRSYIVAVGKIKTAEINRLLLGDQYLPIGRNYKPAVQEFLKALYPKTDFG